jgi:hypothetical protein
VRLQEDEVGARSCFRRLRRPGRPGLVCARAHRTGPRVRAAPPLPRGPPFQSARRGRACGVCRPRAFPAPRPPRPPLRGGGQSGRRRLPAADPETPPRLPRPEPSGPPPLSLASHPCGPQPAIRPSSTSPPPSATPPCRSIQSPARAGGSPPPPPRPAPPVSGDLQRARSSGRAFPARPAGRPLPSRRDDPSRQEAPALRGRSSPAARGARESSRRSGRRPALPGSSGPPHVMPPCRSSVI